MIVGSGVVLGDWTAINSIHHVFLVFSHHYESLHTCIDQVKFYETTNNGLFSYKN